MIPARSHQKAGWGTGVPFADERAFLQQIKAVLPSSVSLTQPWKKLSISRETKSNLQQRFKSNPEIKKPSQGKLPELDQSVKNFLKERIDSQTHLICCCTEEVQAALEKVAQHYFGNSLKLDFRPLQGLSDPIVEEKRNNRSIPNLQHIKEFGQQNQPNKPTPIIIEILSKQHPSYRDGRDPKSHLKSQLPKYNLVPQCIVSTEVSDEVGHETKEVKDLDNPALSAILDAILPFDQNIPLSEVNSDSIEASSIDNTVYAGFYIISRNNKTASKSFNEPVLVCIHKNEVGVLLPERSLEFLSMPAAICKLAHAQAAKNQSGKTEQVINTMLSQLSLMYSSADDIYLFAHAQNARRYWQWLQDSQFDPDHPPTTKIHLIRIRDGMYHEVPTGYGLPMDSENFEEETASFAGGIFVPQACDLEETSFTQTVLSIARKPRTSNAQRRNMSRFQAYSSRRKGVDVPRVPSPLSGWKVPQPRAHNIFATPSPEKIELHHAITHKLRALHWWTPDECEYPLPLSLAEKLKEWAFNEDDSEIP
ncbi:DUF3893 domain-containing protein [Acaryochloris sp. CCMEE 5410]|nr:DUF3893 domain-containing protein [Acaryochloris sp. CCMEE 5410]